MLLELTPILERAAPILLTRGVAIDVAALAVSELEDARLAERSAP